MVSPLGPTFRIFWAYLENRYMAQQDVSMPLHYSRYVDTFFVFLTLSNM